MNILILTTVMAPYRVDLFNEIGKQCNLTVCFEQKKDKIRNDNWYAENFINFDGVFLKNSDKGLSYIKKDFSKYFNKKFDLIIFYEYSTLTSLYYILKCKNKQKFAINCDGAFLSSKTSIKDKIKTYAISKANGCLANGESAKKYFISSLFTRYQ